MNLIHLDIRKASISKYNFKQIAERAGIGITYKNISKYECDRSVPFIEVVLAYARLANVEMNEIHDDDLELNL